MTRWFTVSEKLSIIDKYHELKNMSSTCRWVQRNFNRETFARKSLTKMIARENVYRETNGTKTLRKTVRARSGLYHRMDKELARWVRETRSIGIPVETYMLAIEGTRIMRELYPSQFSEEGVCMFNFSSGWKSKWMEREGFSHRRTTTKKKKNLSDRETTSTISKFFLDTRVFQTSVPGITEKQVFNRDQVPMALAESYASTIDDKNKEVI